MTVFYYPASSVSGFSSLYGTVTLNNALAFTFTGGFEAVGVQPSSPPTSGETVSYQVWAQSAATIAPLVQDTSYTYHIATAINLSAGWNTVTYSVPSGITVLTVGFQANNYTGVLLLNNVGWSTANVVTVTNPAPPAANVGTAVSVQVHATDSASGQTLTFTASGLPAGLSISSSGLITGTPTTAGSDSVTVTATDTTSAQGTTAFTWTVNAANTVTVTNPGSQTLTVGTAFSLQIAASDSASGQTLTFTASGLPAGLSISSSGLITGTPTASGSNSVTVTATDTTGVHASASFSATVNAATGSSGTLTGAFSTANVGAYKLQVNEYNSGATLDLSWTNPPAAFTVSSSSISNATNGSPGAYSSLFCGNHWGTISTVNPFPLQVSAITSGEVTTSIAGSLIGSGAWDFAYDIWFVPTPGGIQTGTDFEMMIWLNHEGSIQPAGSQVATATVGGNSYNVWWSGTLLTFEFATTVISVTNLDLYPLIQYAVSHGYLQNSWYLIDVEAGFEMWTGGTGLEVTSFAVNVGAATPPPPPSNTVTVTNPGSQTLAVGTAYSLTVNASDSAPGQTLTFTASGLPAGLSISSGGIISGTPSATGSSTVIVTATDTTGANGSTSFSATVNAASSGGGSNPPPSGGNVTVDFRTASQAVDPLGVGVVITEFGGNPVPLVSNTGGWKQTMASLAPGHLRCSIAYYSGNPGYGAGGSSRTPGSATALINAIKSIGAIPLVSYNGDSSDNGGLTTGNAAALVHYFNDSGGQNGGPIQYWSVGNEPEVSGPTPSYSTLIPAMTGASSGINVGAPAAAYWDTGLLTSVDGISSLGCLSYHAYDGADSPGSDQGGGGFYNTSQYYNNTGTLKGYRSGILYGVEEFNWNAAPPASETVTWQETAWIADVLGQLLASGAHGTVYGDSNGPLSVISDGSGGQPSFGTPMPAYWGIGIWTGMNGTFKRYSGNMVSATTTFSNTSISAYACDNGKIVVVNKDTSSHALTIAMGGKTSGTYNVSLSQGNPPTGISQVVTGAAYSSSVIDYTMPAMSVASIDVN